jgi:signal transduction histidine kinase
MTEEIPDPSIILFADDDPAGREAIKGLLLSHGYQLIEAEDGVQAVQQAEIHLPDLILLDVMMPGMDGFEACRTLRKNPLLRDIPILLITALDDRDSHLRGLEAGADDFISKPFDRMELRARVRTITRLNRYRRLLAERKRAEEERAGYSKQLHELSKASIRISASLDQQEILQITIQTCLQIIPARMGWICMDDQQKQIPLAIAFNNEGNNIDPFPFETLQKTLCSSTIYHQLVSLSNPIKRLRDELDLDPAWQDLLYFYKPPEFPGNEFIAAPFRRGEQNFRDPRVPKYVSAAQLSSQMKQAVGFLVLWDKINGNFSDNDLSILTQIAQMASVALEKAHLIDEIQQASAHIHDLAREVVTAQETERQSIARELHDESGQELTFLKLSLEMAIDDLPEDMTAVRAELQDMVQLTEKLSIQIRNLAHSLRPPRFDLGLNASLEGLCQEYSRGLKIPVDYRGNNQSEIPEGVSITIYRLLQESLTNIARHANATQVIVCFDVHEQDLQLTVADNGKGFLTEKINANSGAGLRGMRERLELLNGSLTIQSVPFHGTTIIAQVPWSEKK